MNKFLINLKFSLVLTIGFISTANAESISQQELQQRFNKAFSVFHAQDVSSLNQETNTSKSESKKEVQTQTHTNKEEKVQLSTADKNIIKTKETVKVEKRTRSIPKQLTLPSIPRNDSGESIILTELGERSVFIDSQSSTMKEILEDALHQAAPKEHWKIRWRLKDENKYLLKERVNITAEVTFDDFIGNMIDSIANLNGIKLSTKVFYKNRVIIITDTF